MNKKLKLGILVFIIGFIGILSTLTMDIVLPEEIQQKVSELFTPLQFKLLSLINPIGLLLITVVLGVLLYDKVNLKLPLFEKLTYGKKEIELSGILKYGIIGGIIAGILITLVSVMFLPMLPSDFIALGDKFKPTLVMRFFYGGLTEEILIRFGVMTLIIWLIFKLFGKLNSVVYWLGILVSAIIFGLGHLPVVFTFVDAPNAELIVYIIFGNAIGGIVFGWLYWKKGLEAAMVAHIFAHIIMLTGENMFNM
jgi:membrane protease YdiL (CAAX protease family)